jgi:hypothetical protein
VLKSVATNQYEDYLHPPFAERGFGFLLHRTLIGSEITNDIQLSYAKVQPSNFHIFGHYDSLIDVVNGASDGRLARVWSATTRLKVMTRQVTKVKNM